MASTPTTALHTAAFEQDPAAGLSILQRAGTPVIPVKALPHTASALGADFSFPTTLGGSTTHFDVYYDPTLGAAGVTLAKGVLARCETDYNALSALFGGLQVPHFNIILAPGIGGAYHANCSATDLYCDGETTETSDYANFLVVAEETEVFEAKQNKGWQCGWSNGEGLSRALATLQYPAQLNGFATASSWLNAAGRPDYINTNEQTDRNAVSTGCATLFLNYLRAQLGFSWAQITQAAGSTLQDVYANLTHSLDGLDQFKADLQQRFPAGTAVNLGSDNCFPIATAIIKNTLTEKAVNAMSGCSFNGRMFLAWAGTDSSNHLNILSSNHRAVWVNKITLGETSPTGCSLCAFDGRLYLAWAGAGNNHINVMSSPDGLTWENKFTSPENSSARPILAAHAGQLVLAWTGTDSSHHLNVMSSSDGVHWSPKHTLADNSIDAPALVSYNGRLYLAWTGTDSSHHVNVQSSADLGATWQNKVTLTENSIAGPALMVNGQQLLLAWAGTDSSHHLNIDYSTNGSAFGQKVTYGQNSNHSPTLTMAYGAPSLLWTGTDDHLNLWTF